MTTPARALGLLFAVAIASTTAVLAAGDTASGGPTATTEGEIEVARVPAPAREATLEYWTPERLAAAQPLDVTLGAESASTPTPQALNTYAKKVKKPYTGAMKAATGVLFMKLPGGSTYRCSGSAVQGETEIVVWSAGHCVYNAPSAFSCTDPPDEPPGPCEPTSGDPGYVENLVFIPGYKAGSGVTEPFGRFPALELAADAHWRDIGNFRYDFAAFTVDENAHGQSLDQFVAPRELNTGYALTPPLNFKAIGYPAVSPFNGHAQWKCPSEFLGQDISLGSQEEEAFVIGAPLPGEDPIRIMCDMTGGSSGGAWRLGGGVGSNVSYRYGTTNRGYGPYLGAEALALLNSLT